LLSTIGTAENSFRNYDPYVVPEPQVVDPNLEPQAFVGAVQEVLGDLEAAVPQVVVEVPEEEDFSLEVLVVMAIVAFASITMLLSYPFNGLSFWYRFGTWAVIFGALWLFLIIWWNRNNGDRRLLNRVLRQIRGICNV
jgi:hypothetical protein